MPLNRPALSLRSGARGVQDARRWVVDVCRDIDRHDLVQSAELGTSELVTNALLHAQGPLSVRVRGTREHPRVEVRDSTPEPPLMPLTDLAHHDDLLLTFGRGLTIVSRCANAWGVDLDDDGKSVWFAPSNRPMAEMIPGVMTGLTNPTPAPEDDDRVEVCVRAVPLRAYQEFQRHFRELRREVRLLALAHEAEYPLAKDLSDLFGTLERDLREGISDRQVEAALTAGATTADLPVALARTTIATLDRFIELLDLADAFCREERLLSLARSPEQQRFQRWLLGEIVRQEAGETPLPWSETMSLGSFGSFGRPQGAY